MIIRLERTIRMAPKKGEKKRMTLTTKWQTLIPFLSSCRVRSRVRVRVRDKVRVRVLKMTIIVISVSRSC